MVPVKASLLFSCRTFSSVTIVSSRVFNLLFILSMLFISSLIVSSFLTSFANSDAANSPGLGMDTGGGINKVGVSDDSDLGVSLDSDCIVGRMNHKSVRCARLFVPVLNCVCLSSSEGSAPLTHPTRNAVRHVTQILNSSMTLDDETLELHSKCVKSSKIP